MDCKKCKTDVIPEAELKKMTLGQIIKDPRVKTLLEKEWEGTRTKFTKNSITFKM
jgi:hypothetical protein